MKKAGIAILTFLLCFLFAFSCVAEESFMIKTDEDFDVYGETDGIAQRLGMTEEKLQEYLTANDIVYLAVDQNNKKQIRLSISQTEFSYSVGHLSGLTDEKIRTLMPELIGDEHGEIIKKGRQKYIRQEMLLKDDGGEYILTRYITVEAKKYYILSFYTQSGTKTDYIEDVFSSFTSPDFHAAPAEKNSLIKQVLPAALIGIFSLGAGGILFLLIYDMKKPEPEEEQMEQEEQKELEEPEEQKETEE